MQRLPKLGHSCGGLWYLPDGKTLLSTFGGIEQLPGRPVPNEDPRVGQVTFWDTSTWETKAVLGTGARRLIRGASLAISPDGSRLAVLAENQFVAVWNISSSPMPEKPVWEDAWDGGRNATRWVHCVAFSPDGAWIASLQSRRSSPTTRTCEYPLVFYDAASGRPEHEVELRVPSGHEVVFAPDGKRTAVTVSPARQKYLLQVVDATQRKIVKGVDLGEPIYHLRYAPDGRFLAACTRGSVWLFDTQTFQRRLLGQHPTRVPAGYFGGVAISALAMSHDGRLLATGGHEDRPTVRVWDLRTGRLAHILQHPAGHYVYGLAFSPDGSQLVSGVNWDEDGQGAVCVWELPMRSVSELEVRN